MDISIVQSMEENQTIPNKRAVRPKFDGAEDMKALMSEKNVFAFIFSIFKIHRKIETFVDELSDYVNEEMGALSDGVPKNDGKLLSSLYSLGLEERVAGQLTSDSHWKFVREHGYFNPEAFFRVCLDSYEMNTYVDQLRSILKKNKPEMALKEIDDWKNGYPKLLNFTDSVCEWLRTTDRKVVWELVSKKQNHEFLAKWFVLAERAKLDIVVREEFIRRIFFEILPLTVAHFSKLDMHDGLGISSWKFSAAPIKFSELSETGRAAADIVTKALESGPTLSAYVVVSDAIGAVQNPADRAALWSHVRFSSSGVSTRNSNRFANIFPTERLVSREEWAEARLSGYAKRKKFPIFESIDEYKNFIVRMEGSIFSAAIVPIVIHLLSSRVTLRKQQEEWFKRLTYFVSCRNYGEYCHVHAFFIGLDAARSERAHLGMWTFWFMFFFALAYLLPIGFVFAVVIIFCSKIVRFSIPKLRTGFSIFASFVVIAYCVGFLLNNPFIQLTVGGNSDEKIADFVREHREVLTYDAGDAMNFAVSAIGFGYTANAPCVRPGR